jgi:(2Fe-2S) ferredoxin
MVIYPENWWYGNVESESAIDEIIDALEAGKPAETYIMS